jgi:hypothetical protein
MSIAKQLTAITNLIKVLEKSATPDTARIAELHAQAHGLVNMTAPTEHNSFTCACVKVA